MSGSLVSQAPRSSVPDVYIYDPLDVSLAELESSIDPESAVDQQVLYASIGKLLVFHSAPFERDTEISGFFGLSVWLSINQPDTDFRSSVYEVALDGSAVLLTADWMRARYREGFRDERLVDTDAPLRYDFDRFTFVSRLVTKGRRLRLVIGPINSIYSQKNYNSGRPVCEESTQDARPVTVRLFHDETYPSVLHVPIGQAED